MSTYRVLIVEDELHQQESLKVLLQENFPELQPIDIAKSVQEGRERIAQQKPDLAFLDVELGQGETSFDLLQQLKEIPFEIIFTTSFSEHAVKAFRLSAIDYLMKPIIKEELIRSIDKFKTKKLASEANIHISTLLQNLNATRAESKKIALPTLTGFIFVNVKDIMRCESDNTYTTFFITDKRNIVVSRTLKDCEEMLGGCGFIRVHNSHLINTSYVVEYIRGEGGQAKMADGFHVDISRRRKDEFLRAIKERP